MKSSETVIISLRHLSFCRDDIPLFQNLNLDVERGQWLSVRGKNGTGKSTLLKLMAGLLIPDEGEIVRAHQTQLSYVGHQNGQRPYLTLRDQLEAKRVLVESQVSLDMVMDRCQLFSLADVKISQLSAGQQRQGALAALLFCPQSVWLLDEPFEHLDSVSKDRFRGIFEEHLRNGGTICQTSHEDFPSYSAIQEYWLPEQTQQIRGVL